MTALSKERVHRFEAEGPQPGHQRPEDAELPDSLRTDGFTGAAHVEVEPAKVVAHSLLAYRTVTGQPKGRMTAVQELQAYRAELATEAEPEVAEVQSWQPLPRPDKDRPSISQLLQEEMPVEGSGKSSVAIVDAVALLLSGVVNASLHDQAAATEQKPQQLSSTEAEPNLQVPPESEHGPAPNAPQPTEQHIQQHPLDGVDASMSGRLLI